MRPVGVVHCVDHDERARDVGAERALIGIDHGRRDASIPAAHEMDLANASQRFETVHRRERAGEGGDACLRRPGRVIEGGRDRDQERDIALPCREECGDDAPARIAHELEVDARGVARRVAWSKRVDALAEGRDDALSVALVGP